MRLILAFFLDRQDESNAPVDNTPPPDYEAPPDYDDVIKVGMDDEISRDRPGRSRDSEQPTTSRCETLPSTIEVALRRPGIWFLSILKLIFP